MGLAGPRKRRKIGNDPNNTSWSSSTETFGHRMLTSQGWTPGNYLGALDAAHASHYTAASQAHVRVLLKDDNLGIGAARAQAEGKEFGLLGGFQDLLGRLNGKDEVKLGQEQQARADIGRKMYAEMKWGPARFVRGGFLVGDKIEEIVPDGEIVLPEQAVAGISGAIISAADVTNDEPGEATKTDEHEKREERREAEKKNTSLEDPANERLETKEERRQRRLLRRTVKKARTLEGATSTTNPTSLSANTKAIPASTTSSSSETPSTSTKAERKQQRAEKRARKEVKRLAKSLSKSVAKNSLPRNAIPIASTPTTGISTPKSGISMPNIGGGLAVRQRYLKQKRMASMDPRALREILMLKS